MDYERAISVGQYTKPIGEVSELADKSGDSQLLWRLHCGSLGYLADDRALAVRMFDGAEDIFAKNDQASVFKQAGDGAFAMMTNDKAFAYDACGQDRIFACLYKSIDYMTGGEKNAARTELNRAAQRQENWLWERRKTIAEAGERLKADAAAYDKEKKTEDASKREGQVAGVLGDASFAAKVKAKCGYDAATSGNLDMLAAKDYMNVYAQHVTGIFRWLTGDNARNYLKDVATLNSGNSVGRRDYEEFEKGVRPQNQVWIFVEDGLCPCREEWRVDLPLGLLPGVGRYVLYAGMALPYLRERAHGALSWSVLAGGRNVAMEQLADVDALLKVEFDVYMRGALAREVTRTIVKIGTQVALGVTADAASDSKTKMALRLSQYAAAGWAASTTAADLRSWTALPKTVKVARVDRPENGHLAVMADGRHINIQLQPGNSMVFIRKVAPSAPPVVKVAAL